MLKEADEIRVIFGNPSQKEEAMYEAVIEMVNEQHHVSQIKVSDITKRAGIGKGTAYEYFSSKEEIVVKALLYDAYCSIKRVEQQLKGAGGFEEKFYWLLQFIEENISKTSTLSELMRMNTGKLAGVGDLGNCACEEKRNLVCRYVNKMADLYMQQGYEEGLFTENSPQLKRNCLYTQIMGYMVFITTAFHDGEVSREEARRFTYLSLLKSLNASLKTAP